MPFDEDGGTGTPDSAAYDSKPTFDPYEPPTTPEVIQPTPSPAPSSDAPGFGGTSGTDDEQPVDPDGAPQEQQDAAPLPEFDEKYKEPFTGLLYLGRLQKTFTKWGHVFVVRTVTSEQMAEIGLIVREYLGTPVENAVYQSAVVAACVVTVDGQPLPGTILVDDTMELTQVKFPYVLRNWMPPLREEIYNECFSLEIESRKVLEAMGKASG
jgi:hypothetical protein